MQHSDLRRAYRSMNPLSKAIRASEGRVTRFHTERGELMPPSAWLRVPQALWVRVTSGGSNKPWMVPSAVSHLAQIISKDWNVFEFGSGWSTLWYAERSGTVTSVEHDPRWYDLVRLRLRDQGISNCDVPEVHRGLWERCIRLGHSRRFRGGTRRPCKLCGGVESESQAGRLPGAG
jgi:hypothetical protein